MCVCPGACAKQRAQPRSCTLFSRSLAFTSESHLCVPSSPLLRSSRSGNQVGGLKHSYQQTKLSLQVSRMTEGVLPVSGVAKYHTSTERMEINPLSVIYCIHIGLNCIYLKDHFMNGVFINLVTSICSNVPIPKLKG